MSNTQKELNRPCIYCKNIIQAATAMSIENENPNQKIPNKNRARKKKQERAPVEHVIPEMIGLFGQHTMTLDDMVCAKCNALFSKKLELSFGRDSVYGILYRCIAGMLPREKFSKSIRHKREKLTFEVYYPDYGNILVDIQPDNASLFMVRLADQFSILNSTKGVRVHYPKNQLPHKGELEALGLPMHPPNISFLGPVCKPEELSKKIQDVHQKLIYSDIQPLKNLAIINQLPPLPNNSPLMFSSKVDDIIIRTVAKIGFNYFAYNFGYRIAISEHFNDIRHYVLYGLKTNYNIVRLTHNVINEHIDNLSKEKFGHHTVSVFQHGNQIIAKIILFNRDIFDVIISNSYPIYSREFFSAHRFSILKKTVESI